MLGLRQRCREDTPCTGRKSPGEPGRCVLTRDPRRPIRVCGDQWTGLTGGPKTTSCRGNSAYLCRLTIQSGCRAHACYRCLKKKSLLSDYGLFTSPSPSLPSCRWPCISPWPSKSAFPSGIKGMVRSPSSRVLVTQRRSYLSEPPPFVFSRASDTARPECPRPGTSIRNSHWLFF
jgi:hypothetical protein